MPKEESDTLGDLRFSWRKLKTIADALTDKLRGTQAGLYSLILTHYLLCHTAATGGLLLPADHTMLHPTVTLLHVHRRASVRDS